jgi:hypothetical protein
MTPVRPVACAVAALAMLVAVPSGGSPRTIGDVGTVVVSMRGTLVPDRRAADDAGWGGISFGFAGDAVATMRWFRVIHASLSGGNTFDAKSAVFRTHYVPALRVVGPTDLARKLAALPDGTTVRVQGVIDRRSRNLLLDVVQPLE